MNPQLVDTGKVYSIKPEDRKGDFTFTRSSAATRVNADGLVEKETQNLFLQSNSFNTGNWNYRAGDSATSGQSGYDGTNDAWLLNVTTGGWSVYQNQNLTGVYTFSLYVKAGTIDVVQIDFFSSGTTYSAQFNLTSGTDIGGNNTIDRTITDIGSGWYRISVSANVSSTLYTRIGSVSLTGNFYIQDAQLEQGLVARDYIETTTTAVDGGITDNVPRLDYTDSSCPSLLLEPSRTNSIKQSEYINGWNFLSNVNVIDNAATSPEGVLNASKIIPTTAAGSQKVLDVSGFNRTSGEYISHTIYAKASGYNYLYLSNSADRLFAVYDLSGGSVDYVSSNGTDFINHSASIESVGNGWYRCALIGEAVTSIGSYLRVSVAPTSETTSAPAYTADGTSGILVYGAQVELNSSYATSYIPTYGSSVTRVLETCQVEDEGALINSEQGALYFEGIAIDPSYASVMSFSDGTLTNRICLTLPQNATNINAFSSVGGSKIDNYILHDPSVNSKYAIVWNGNSFKVFVNGVKKVDNTMAGSFSANTLTDIRFDRGDGALNFEGFCKSYLSIATALTDQEAIDLTTI